MRGWTTPWMICIILPITATAGAHVQILAEYNTACIDGECRNLFCVRQRGPGPDAHDKPALRLVFLVGDNDDAGVAGRDHKEQKQWINRDWRCTAVRSALVRTDGCPNTAPMLK